MIRIRQSKSGLNQTGSGTSYPIVKEQNPLSSRKLKAGSHHSGAAGWSQGGNGTASAGLRAPARMERAGRRGAVVFADGVRFAGAPQRSNDVPLQPCGDLKTSQLRGT